MLNKHWIITDYCKDNLKQLGFLYDPKMDYWRYLFPVRFWKRRPTLFCSILISRDKDYVCVNVIDNMNNFYPAFYCQEYGHYGDFIETAEKKILYKLKSLGIIEKKSEIKEKKKYGHTRVYRKSSKNKIPRRRS